MAANGAGSLDRAINGPLVRALETFLTTRDLALPTDHADRPDGGATESKRLPSPLAPSRRVVRRVLAAVS